MDDSLPDAGSRHAVPARCGEPWRGRAARAAAWGALVLALALTFRAYLDPSLTLDFGAFMQLCGLR